MSIAVKLRRGTTAEHAEFAGAEGEVTVDTDKKTVVVHDGLTAGGIPLATEEAVSELFISVSDGKTVIATAITDKGGTASGSDTFTELADAIGALSTGTSAVTSSYNTATEGQAQHTANAPMEAYRTQIT